MFRWEKLIYKKQGLSGILAYLFKAFLSGALLPGAILWALLDKKGLIRWLTNGVVSGKDNDDN